VPVLRPSALRSEKPDCQACSKMLLSDMANGTPVRLSSELAARARTAALTQERSLTDQVEHWARLGQAVEDAILAATAKRLKARSHDPALSMRLAHSKTREGRAKAAEMISRRDPVRHGVGPKGSIRVVRNMRKTRR
jgi:hypothetical protein